MEVPVGYLCYMSTLSLFRMCGLCVRRLQWNCPYASVLYEHLFMEAPMNGGTHKWRYLYVSVL